MCNEVTPVEEEDTVVFGPPEDEEEGVRIHLSELLNADPKPSKLCHKVVVSSMCR